MFFWERAGFASAVCVPALFGRIAVSYDVRVFAVNPIYYPRILTMPVFGWLQR